MRSQHLSSFSWCTVDLLLRPPGILCCALPDLRQQSVNTLAVIFEASVTCFWAMAQRSFENCQLEENNTLVSKSLNFLACCTLFLTLVIGSGFWQIHFKDSLTLEIVGCMSIQKKICWPVVTCNVPCPEPTGLPGSALLVMWGPGGKKALAQSPRKGLKLMKMMVCTNHTALGFKMSNVNSCRRMVKWGGTTSSVLRRIQSPLSLSPKKRANKMCSMGTNQLKLLQILSWCCIR